MQETASDVTNYSGEDVIGVIYSISDLGDHLVEIRNGNQRSFVEDKEGPCKYGNLADAKHAARSNGAVKLFLALNKTYEEVDSKSDNLAKSSKDRFDYLPINPEET